MLYSKSPNYNTEIGRFEHPEGDKQEKSFANFMSFAFEFFVRENDSYEQTGFPVKHSSKKTLQNFSENVIWVGHSSLLLNHNNLTILTDPHFSDRASPFISIGPKRVTPVPFSVADLPKIDVVLISHNHYDHLDEVTIRKLVKLQPETRFIVPLGLMELLKSFGAKNITELDWWQPVNLGEASIQPTPVQHWSKRSTFDRNKTLWAAWMVKWPDFSFYFAGDAGYSNDFKNVAQKLGKPTLAAIPIGAYEPREFMKAAHANPDEAVKIFLDLGAKYAIGIHWGTFKLTLEPMNEPPLKLKEAIERYNISKDRFRTLKHGEQWPEIFLD